MSNSPVYQPIQYLKGVGPQFAKILAKKEIHTIFDLLYFFPRDYIDCRKITKIADLSLGLNQEDQETCLFVVQVVENQSLPQKFPKPFRLYVEDETDSLQLTWFYYHQSLFQKLIKTKQKLLIRGKVRFFGNQKQMVHPEIEYLEDDQKIESYQKILPLYSLTERLSQKKIRSLTSFAIEKYLEFIHSPPEAVRPNKKERISLTEAIRAVHFPPPTANYDELKNHHSLWHKRIQYDELFYFQLGLKYKKNHTQQEKALSLNDQKFQLYQKALNNLPFELTTDQKQVIKRIQQDVLAGFAFNRILQGDVGCGKTIVAFLAALLMVGQGYQAVLMAPTEILATQHYQNLLGFGQKIGVRLALLVGSLKKKQKEIIYQDLAAGKIDFIIGTHALIQDPIEFSCLAMIIIDEQHRFGVRQRAVLKSKAKNSSTPHNLVMTATPIPRTLSMMLYGDLDLLKIGQKPKGRKKIISKVFNYSQRPAFLEQLKSMLDQHQIYFVCPFIEEDENQIIQDVKSLFAELKKAFKPYKIGMIHGKLKANEKEETMASFQKGDLQILIATTVIEVGVDVPNATVMVIENAERFGLSQLHQLRGRVGRGERQSYCFFILGRQVGVDSFKRLKLMETIDDGFELAQKDLELRGPGDFLGTRQSGLPSLKLMEYLRDTRILHLASQRVEEILTKDPHLELVQNQAIRQVLFERWYEKLKLADIG